MWRFKGWILSQVNRSHMHPSEIRFWLDLKLCSQRLQREKAEEGCISFYNPLDHPSLSVLPREWKGFWHQRPSALAPQLRRGGSRGCTGQRSSPAARSAPRQAAARLWVCLEWVRGWGVPGDTVMHWVSCKSAGTKA